MRGRGHPIRMAQAAATLSRLAGECVAAVLVVRGRWLGVALRRQLIRQIFKILGDDVKP